MDRRNFLTSAISSVVAGIGFVESDRTTETEQFHGGSSDGHDCGACSRIEGFKTEVANELVPDTPETRERIRHMVDPANHGWDGDCRYNGVLDGINESHDTDFTITQDLVKTMDYDIEVTTTQGFANVTVTLHPTIPSRVIDSAITVGTKNNENRN